MKLLTLNTHSLMEENYERKLADFVEVAAKECPDIIALQEVNQQREAEACREALLVGYTPCAPRVTVRADNHGLRVAEGLRMLGIPYAWTWLPVKLGYGIYDEGLALFSRSPIVETKVIDLTPAMGYENWKARKILGVRTQDKAHSWFYSVHFGWWEDAETSFSHQWTRVREALPRGREIWLMGDFNHPAHIRGEGYDLVASSGWYDSYLWAEEKDDGITVNQKIAGWENDPFEEKGLRIDQIWCNTPPRIRSSRVIFDGRTTPVVSDHFGVLVTTEE